MFRSSPPTIPSSDGEKNGLPHRVRCVPKNDETISQDLQHNTSPENHGSATKTKGSTWTRKRLAMFSMNLESTTFSWWFWALALDFCKRRHFLWGNQSDVQKNQTLRSIQTLVDQSRFCLDKPHFFRNTTILPPKGMLNPATSITRVLIDPWDSSLAFNRIREYWCLQLGGFGQRRWALALSKTAVSLESIGCSSYSQIPSGKRLHDYGKSPFMRKSNSTSPFMDDST